MQVTIELTDEELEHISQHVARRVAFERFEWYEMRLSDVILSRLVKAAKRESETSDH